MLETIEIVTERLLIRPLRPNDATERYSSWFESPDVRKNIVSHDDPHTVQALRSFIEGKRAQENVLFLGIFTRDTHLHIGNIKYEPVDRERKYAVMGILIGEADWKGRGVASEAIKATGFWLRKNWDIRSLHLGVYNENKSGIRAYEKVGFKISSTSRVTPDPLGIAMTWEIPSENAAGSSIWNDFFRMGRVFRHVLKIFPSLSVQSIHWLYPRHYPPPVVDHLLAFQRMGKGIPSVEFDRKAHLKLAVKFWYFLIKSFAHAFEFSLLSIYATFCLKGPLKKFDEGGVDVLGLSFLVSADFGKNGSDFYYGDLQSRLLAKGKKSLFFYMNFGPRSSLSFISMFKRPEMEGKLPEWCFVHWGDPFRMLWAQWKEFPRLLRVVFRAKNKFLKEILSHVLVYSLSHQTFKNGLYSWISKNAVTRGKPKVFLTAYEGQSWEHCAFLGAKKADPQCQTVGYQHTAVFKESLCLLKPYTALSLGIRPDIVLSLGDIPLNLLMASDSSKKVKYVRFGSFRFQPGKRAENPADVSKKTVLVTPEGLAKEVIFLFTFAYQCAKKSPDFKFILRCHPVFPIELVLSQLPGDILVQPNIEVSRRKDINEDFERSSVLLYRRSSSCLYGLLQGLKLIYLSQAEKIDSDPLFNMDAWRRECQSVEGFLSILREDSSTSSDVRAKDWAKGVDYVLNYTGPVGPEQIDEFLKTSGV